MVFEVKTQADLTQPGRFGAFVKDGLESGPNVPQTSTQLQGMRLAIKDVFDIEGLRTGAGNPVWWHAQRPAKESAYAVSALLAAGALWVGKTVTDELAYSLNGANIHYGTPENPADARRLPGGSSSGSAVAVASGFADIALATDCGGSARLPASYCGIWGMRPSHGKAGSSGFQLAPSFDTVGWFSSSSDAMMSILQILAPETQAQEPKSWLISQDMLDVCVPEVQTAMEALQSSLDLPVRLLPSGTLPLAEWVRAYRVLSGAEIWKQHEAWVNENGDHLAQDVKAQFTAASKITIADVESHSLIRKNATQTLAGLLADNTMILMPTVPGPAPLCTATQETLSKERLRAQHLIAPAGLAGLPQVTMPWIEIGGAPVGLSVIGARGTDGTTLLAAQLLEEHLRNSQNTFHTV